MVFRIRRSIVLFVLAVSSPFFFLKDASALVPIEQIKMLMDMMYDVYKNLDPAAAYDLARVRNDLPQIIQNQSTAIQPKLQKSYDEMKANMEDHLAKTGQNGIPMQPNTQQLLMLIQTLVDATFNQGFQQGLANGYSDYAAQITTIKNSIAAPTDGSTPTAPPTDALKAGIAYFQNQAAQVRASSGRFGGIKVSGASDPWALQRSFESAQAQIAALLNGNKFNDGAVQGIINALSRMKERAIAMQQRPDHENDIYDQEEADGLVTMANNLIQTSAKTPLEEVATFTDFIVSELQKALDSIVNPVEGQVPGDTARGIVDTAAQNIASRAAAAQSAANAAAAAVSSAKAAVDSYWTNQLYATRIHCHWEEQGAALVIPLYAMADEFNNLNDPEVFLTALNSSLWTQLKGEILRITGLLKTSIENENASVSKAVASNIGYDTTLPPITGVPHNRFTGQCGQYVPDPQNQQAVVTTSAVTVTSSVSTLSEKARRATRELKRQSKTKAKPKPKKNTPSKPTPKFKQNVNRSVKKFKANLGANMNQAYKDAFKIYPPVPFRGR